MIKGEGDIVIHRPIEDIWKFLTDFENYPKWHKGMAKARQTSKGPTGAGTTVEVVAEILGRHRMKLLTFIKSNEKLQIAERVGVVLWERDTVIENACHAVDAYVGHLKRSERK